MNEQREVRSEEVAEFLACPYRWGDPLTPEEVAAFLANPYQMLAAEAPSARNEDRTDGRPRRVKGGMTETPCARCGRWTRLDAEKCGGCGGAMDWAKEKR